MKKFLISDYDGTFHIDDESMKNNIEKVKEFRKNGNIFAIATGRSFYNFTKLLDKFNIEYDYLIINHGATLLDKNHNIINNYSIGNIAKENVRAEFDLVDDEYIFVCKCLESRISILEDDITKIHIKCKSKEEQINFNDILNSKYGNFVKSYLITGLTNSIEIISCKTNKSIAIKQIAKIENISRENIYTVGDSFNDLEMLEAFNGFCMESGEETVKNKVSNKCSTVEEVIDKIYANNSIKLPKVIDEEKI